MSTPKPAVVEKESGTPEASVPPVEAPRSVPDIAINSLELDDGYEDGGDPYNRTGQHLIADMKRKFDQG